MKKQLVIVGGGPAGMSALTDMTGLSVFPAWPRSWENTGLRRRQGIRMKDLQPFLSDREVCVNGI